MNWKRNMLTDSGGFQMVSLLHLAKITEVSPSYFVLFCWFGRRRELRFSRPVMAVSCYSPQKNQLKCRTKSARFVSSPFQFLWFFYLDDTGHHYGFGRRRSYPDDRVCFCKRAFPFYWNHPRRTEIAWQRPQTEQCDGSIDVCCLFLLESRMISDFFQALLLIVAPTIKTSLALFKVSLHPCRNPPFPHHDNSKRSQR